MPAAAATAIRPARIFIENLRDAVATTCGWRAHRTARSRGEAVEQAALLRRPAPGGDVAGRRPAGHQAVVRSEISPDLGTRGAVHALDFNRFVLPVAVPLPRSEQLRDVDLGAAAD